LYNFLNSPTTSFLLLAFYFSNLLSSGAEGLFMIKYDKFLVLYTATLSLQMMMMMMMMMMIIIIIIIIIKVIFPVLN